jgi:hypothetical protein
MMVTHVPWIAVMTRPKMVVFILRVMKGRFVSAQMIRAGFMRVSPAFAAIPL